VQFFDGATNIGSGTLSGGQATLATSSLANGSHTITATYGGDGSYNGSTSAPLSHSVNLQATITGLTTSGSPSTFGQLVTFTATVTGGATPTGTVQFLDGATVLATPALNGSGAAVFSTSTLSVATHSITAVYGGDGTHSGSTSSAVSQVVNKATSNTALSSDNNPSTFGESVTFTATVTGAGATPTGTVQFLDGATVIGSDALDGTGHATLTLSTLGAGTHSITASYGGSGNHLASTSSAVSQSVDEAATTTTITGDDPDPSADGADVTVDVQVSSTGGTPTGSVSVTDGSDSCTINSLSSGTGSCSLPLNGLGTHTITATYNGDGNFATSQDTEDHEVQ
jgi:hypothetical protein